MERFDELASAQARWLERIAPPDEHAADVRLEILLLNAIREGASPQNIAAIAGAGVRS
jgi:hypothetical protein